MVNQAIERAKTISEELREQIQHDLTKAIRGDVKFDRYTRAIYATDASIYEMEPVGLVLPRNAADVARSIEIARNYEVPVLPRGGGTSLSGQGCNHAVVLDFTKYMSSVVEINQEEQWAITQPGITVSELNHHAKKHGLQYAPDPSTANRATIGGGIGNNSCGAHSVIYGKTSDQVIDLEVITAQSEMLSLGAFIGDRLEQKKRQQNLEGNIYREVHSLAMEHSREIEKRYPKIQRRVSGYNLEDLLQPDACDLTKIIVGSEGTLVAVTEAKVKLVSLPKVKGLGVVLFKTLLQSMEATIEALSLEPAAIELVDRMIIERTKESPGFSRKMNFVAGDPAALLLVEFFGESSLEVLSKLEKLKNIMTRSNLSYNTTILMDPEDQANVWEIRKAGLGLLMSVKGDVKPLPFVEDTAVAPEKLPQYVEKFDQIIRDHGTEAGYYGHASVGCLHIRPLVNIKTQEGVEKLTSISEQIAQLVLEFGGSLSGEHGDGIVRGAWTKMMFGPALYDAFRRLKHIFDPREIMNPGKIIDCPPLTENLRIDPNYKVKQTKTNLDFSQEGGISGAVELCTGVGDCRKTLTGTMCPSYMATRDEEHTTRGRANALRAVLSGSLTGENLGSTGLHKILDLCLECKGCKGECPSNVDMAKIKYEVLAQKYEAGGFPLRSRIFADIEKLNKIGSKLAPISNWLAKSIPSRLAMHLLVGIHWKRTPPPFSRKVFSKWFYERPEAKRAKAKVVLFHDTFMEYNYPEIGKAATSVLEAIGYEVILVNKGCCGRPAISKGMINKAKDMARKNIEVLYAYAKRGIPIVGCEPSCVLTIRDEYKDMLKGKQVDTVLANTYMIEEFLTKNLDKDQSKEIFHQDSKSILFHGHCHQKALIGVKPTLDVLRGFLGHNVTVVNSSCCGMAGSFGFEKEHYDLSKNIGKMKLIPAITAQEHDGKEVIITGVSCRQQISHLSNKQPKHVVELLADALV